MRAVVAVTQVTTFSTLTGIVVATPMTTWDISATDHGISAAEHEYAWTSLANFQKFDPL